MKQKLLTKGFTLVEMLVVLAIFVLLTMLVLVKNSQFSSATILESVAYDLALSVREAQIYGISVRAQESGGSFDEFDTPYGIQFSTQTQSAYILFGDVNGDEKYSTGVDTIIKQFTLPRGYSINQICYSVGGNIVCDAGCAHISFMRPEPDSNMNVANNCSTGTINAVIVEIHVTSAYGGSRKVVVESSGQIAVQ